jgi:hypothetical protein
MFTHFLPKGNKLMAMKPNGSRTHVVVGRKPEFVNKVDWGTHPSRAGPRPPAHPSPSSAEVPCVP